MFTLDSLNFLQSASIYWLTASEGAEHLSLLERILESNLINVLIAALVLGFLAKKFNLSGGIESQRLQIASEIEAIERQKQEALSQLEDAKQRTANLKQEVDEILVNARQSAESISGQIIANAQLESSKIVENAKRRVELEQRSALKDLQTRLLSDALDDARAELAQTLTPQDRQRSVETFLDELGDLKGGERL